MISRVGMPGRPWWVFVAMISLICAMQRVEEPRHLLGLPQLERRLVMVGQPEGVR